MLQFVVGIITSCTLMFLGVAGFVSTISKTSNPSVNRYSSYNQSYTYPYIPYTAPFYYGFNPYYPYMYNWYPTSTKQNTEFYEHTWTEKLYVNPLQKPLTIVHFISFKIHNSIWFKSLKLLNYIGNIELLQIRSIVKSSTDLLKSETKQAHFQRLKTLKDIQVIEYYYTLEDLPPSLELIRRKNQKGLPNPHVEDARSSSFTQLLTHIHSQKETLQTIRKKIQELYERFS